MRDQSAGDCVGARSDTGLCALHIYHTPVLSYTDYVMQSNGLKAMTQINLSIGAVHGIRFSFI